MYEWHEGREIQESGKMWVKNGVLKNFIYLFSCCTGSLFLHRIFFFFFPSCGKQGQPSSCGAWTSLVGFSCCGAWAPGHAGFSSGSTWLRGSRAQAQQLWRTHSLSCSVARGIIPDQGLNSCLLHWQADSLPLSHQGSPPKLSWGKQSLRVSGM